LVETCILAGSRPGDLVFDPFIGSGTVGLVAEKLGRRWVGMDLNPQYVARVDREARARRGARIVARFTDAELAEIIGCDAAAA
jgi:DNA modification methylase